MALLRITPPTPSAYLFPDQVKTRLNGRKNQPNNRSMIRWNQSRSSEALSPSPPLEERAGERRPSLFCSLGLGLRYGLSRTADSAGESVSELMAVITVE